MGADEPTQPARNERVTLKTIAEMTGLSLSTVSLSLRGGTTLKQETRDKVNAAAKALGYVPDRAGVRLRTGKTNVLTLVLDGAEDSVDFARQMIQGIGQEIAGTRYHLNVTPEFSSSQSTETIRYILDSRAADGVIITHTAPDDPRVAMMMEAGFPFVSHGRTAFSRPHPYHDFHAEAFARHAVERLAAKGCRKLMLLIGDDRTTNFRNLTTAFEAAARQAGIAGEVRDNGLARRDPSTMRALGLELAARDDRPDGIVCDGEMQAIALVGGLLEGGLKPGEDIGLVYKQTSGILPTLFPRVDSIQEDILSAGGELTRLLLRRIAGEPVEQLQTLAEPVLHWRS